VAASGLDDGAEADEERLLASYEAEWSEAPTTFPDPFEGWNRRVFRFNLGVDRWAIEPVTRAYSYAVPEAGRHAVRRFFDNLNTPVVLANDLLQGELRAAGVTAYRFTLNSTVGVGGLFDPASALGAERHDADFGQTLALAGAPSGPYLVVPLFGPTTVRDAVGTLGNFFFRPTTYLLAGADQFYYMTIYGGSVGVVAREANADGIRLLESSSVDYYAAMRSAYYQTRIAEIWQRRQRPLLRTAAAAVPG